MEKEPSLARLRTPCKTALDVDGASPAFYNFLGWPENLLLVLEDLSNSKWTHPSIRYYNRAFSHQQKIAESVNNTSCAFH